MDEKDEEILEVLRENGRKSYTKVAEQVGVSEGTIRNRVDSMKEKGIIEGFTVETSVRNVSAVLLAKMATESNPDSVISKLPTGLQVYEVTGEHDLVITIQESTTEELNDSIDEIRGIKGITETVTKSVLNEVKT